MTTVKVRRIANPRRSRARNIRHHKRRMSAKQIKYFGTKAQKAALRARNRRHSNRTHPNVRRNVRRRGRARVSRHRLRTRRNALVVTLGSVNPRRRRKNVPATKTNRRRRRNVAHRNRHPRRRRHYNARHRNRTPMAYNPRRRRNRRRSNVRHYRRRRNGPRIVVMRPNRRRRYNRRRNPVYGQSIFGGPLFGRNAMELIGGGFLGLVAAKFIPNWFATSSFGSGMSSITGTNFGRVIISGISAVLAGWGASKISIPLGQGVLFGGMVQTVSVLLNVFLPSVYTALNPSLGDIVPGSYTVPQNPIRAGMTPIALPAPASPATTPTSGQVRMGRISLNSAYSSAY